jgi:hypothetical protein
MFVYQLSPVHFPLLRAERPVSSTRRHQEELSIEVQYRQLVSRAATQRLHSPSLDEDLPAGDNKFLTWEMNERRKARNKAKMQVCMFDRSWSTFPRIDTHIRSNLCRGLCVGRTAGGARSPYPHSDAI